MSQEKEPLLFCTKLDTAAVAGNHPHPSRDPPLPLLVGVACVQAFYLTHVDECLALAVAGTAAVHATATPPTPTSKRVLEEKSTRLHHPFLDHHQHQRHQPSDGAKKSKLESATLPPSSPRSLALPKLRTSSLVSLSAEEAWRYCCARRPDFPAMFAVYRHFRARK